VLGIENYCWLVNEIKGLRIAFTDRLLEVEVEVEVKVEVKRFIVFQ
jgi:hypothetical protein